MGEFDAALKKMKDKIDLNKVSNLDPRVVATEINLLKPLERQPMVLSKGSDWQGNPNCVMGNGDYSVITGLSKSKKSFFKSMLIASYIGGDETDESMPFSTHRRGDKLILDIDTEQSDYHTQRAGKRVARILQGDYKGHRVFGWQQNSPKERMEMLTNLIETYKTDIGIIFLDGYIDFVNDFNDKVECIAFQNQIMKWCHQYKFHICGVLHKNPNGQKMIGHIGSIMERKAATIIFLEKSPNDKNRSLVCHERARDMEFNEFEIEIDRGLPFARPIQAI